MLSVGLAPLTCMSGFQRLPVPLRSRRVTMEEHYATLSL